MESKIELRNRIKKLYEGLDRAYIELASSEIARAIFDMRWYKDAKTILCYMNMGNEVITDEIITRAAEGGKRVCIPRCLASGIMESRMYRTLENRYELVEGVWGIREPSKDNPPVRPEEIDLVIAPCLTCDRKGNRLGHGAGYYDRYLSPDNGMKAAKLCLCFSKILAEEVYTDEYDIRMDAVVTEERIYYER